jgi:nucleotide-binding universal stress UspA family protein
MILADTLPIIEQRARERTREARAHMEEFCKSQNIAVADGSPGPDGVSAAWRELSAADEWDSIVAESRFHDVVVLAGGPERTRQITEEGLGSIVLRSGRPVVLAPERPMSKPIKNIAIAWKTGAETARAVTAAMPLLSQANRIDVLSANESDLGATGCVECCDRVVRQLRWHGLNAYSHFIIPAGRTAPDAILETARDYDANLVVMGAYGRSRMRELIFGGFTQHILHGAALPVLLFH